MHSTKSISSNIFGIGNKKSKNLTQIKYFRTDKEYVGFFRFHYEYYHILNEIIGDHKRRKENRLEITIKDFLSVSWLW